MHPSATDSTFAKFHAQGTKITLAPLLHPHRNASLTKNITNTAERFCLIFKNFPVLFQFRRQFVHVVSRRIAALFHYHDKNKMDRMDADNLEMHRIN